MLPHLLIEAELVSQRQGMETAQDVVELSPIARAAAWHSRILCITRSPGWSSEPHQHARTTACALVRQDRVLPTTTGPDASAMCLDVLRLADGQAAERFVDPLEQLASSRRSVSVAASLAHAGDRPPAALSTGGVGGSALGTRAYSVSGALTINAVAIYWDDLHLLRVLHQLEVDDRAYQLSGDLLFQAVAEGLSCTEQDQRSFVRLLLLMEDRGYLQFEQMHYAGLTQDPRPADQNYLHSLWHFQLTEAGRDRAQARVLQALVPEPGEDDGHPIPALILRRFSDQISENYNEEQIQLFMRDYRLPFPQAAKLPDHGTAARTVFLSDSLELLEAGDIELRRHLRLFLAAYLNGALDVAPEPAQREVLLSSLARAGWHLTDTTLIAGERVRASAQPEAAQQSGDDVASGPVRDASSPIFLVHGHAEDRLHAVARFIEQISEHKVVILHEQPNQGRTLIEKFEHNAAQAAHAVVLLTADDCGRSKAADPSEEQPRGRQNVVLELGFFIGKLGREHVTVLLDPEVEEPSDLRGLVYIPLDPAGTWKLDLAQELKADDIQIDMNRLA
jgi:predicted nucleotide-binding protein